MASNSKRSLIEYAALLRRNGCPHGDKDTHYLCRACGEELAAQIAELGSMMIKLRNINEEMEKLKNLIPVYMFRQD